MTAPYPSIEPATGPQPEAVPSATPRYSWGHVVQVAMEHRRELVVANLVAIVAVLASVPIPLLMPLLVDEVLLDQPGTLVGAMQALFPQAWHGPVLYVMAMLLLTVVLRVASTLLGVWQTRQFSIIAKELTYRMRRTMLERLQRISMAEYETLGSGAVSSHFVTDLNAIDEFIGTTISRALIAVLSLVGITVILVWMHWPLALFILLMNPAVIYFTMVLGKRVKRLKKRENEAFEIFQQALTETLDAIHQIRASNRERHYIQAVVDRARGIKTHSAEFSWQSDAASRFSFGVFLIGFDTFRAISMLMVVFSDLTVGQMMAVFGYLWFMMSPVQEVLNIQYAYFGAKAALGRVNRLLGLREEPQYPNEINPFQNRRTVGVHIEDVSFAYTPDTPVLRHVSLDITPGEKVALVGASGGGKSTLVQVLLGMYPAQSGMVYFDGVPVTRIGLDVVRDNVATVLQHPALFNDTVRMNLSLGRALSDERMWQALEVAQLRSTVEQLPAGLDTVIGRQGIRLSGGQRQRLAIARMLLSAPKVVVLDEATSALDPTTESELHAAMHDFLVDRTTLIIAHRLSSVLQADRVYVFEDGHVIEEGPHETLIKQGGLYSRLYGHYQS